MAVIIGGGSSVTSSLLADGTGVVSISFDYQANIERLWELGSFSPYDSTVNRQRNVSLVVYGSKPTGAGGTTVQALDASTTCADSSSISLEFNAAVCTGGAASFSDTFFATSYSYSKDFNGYGKESWAMVTKPIYDDYTGTIYMLRGIATGQILIGTEAMSEAEMGFITDDAGSRDSSGNYIESESGSVNAGFPGIGDFETKREVVVSSVGDSIGKKDGYKGQCNCSIPTQPIYL
jgi:hypothetical protein